MNRTVLLAALLASTQAFAGSIFTETGQDLAPRDKAEVELDGYLRMRGETLGNLDLDRGLTPSGRPLFPVPTASPGAQTLTHADMRMRLDLAVYAPGGGLAVKTRADLLDNLSLGSTPAGYPAGSTTQEPPQNVLRLKRAWGEALTPVGILAAGRMGNDWGLGMLANAGDCVECDSGDAADRIAFVTPLAGHLWAAAYDFSATGPYASRVASTRSIDLEPTDDVRSVTFAVLRWKDDDGRDRRRKAGKTTFEYGAYVSHRWQEDDVPSSYFGVGESDGTVMYRGFRTTALDGWLRLTFPSFRVEAEVAALLAEIEQASLLPGALYRQPVTSTQIGAAVETEVGGPESALRGGLDFGFASGDPAPGFGAFPPTDGSLPKGGDLDGAQANPPRDSRVDNFRFHPDYHVDRILFRELIGAVTDAIYVRPHLRWRIAKAGPGVLVGSIAGIASWANYASSTPGGARPLGIELDPTLSYESHDGFHAALEYAVLFPLAGLDNPVEGLEARTAQLLRLRLAYLF